jgi:hypothetical protein
MNKYESEWLELAQCKAKLWTYLHFKKTFGV